MLTDYFLDTPYPIDALPPLIRDAVAVVAAQTGVPVEVAAASALTAAAAAVQGSAKAENPATRSSVYCGRVLFSLVVSDSPADKRLCDRLFAPPFWDAGALVLDCPIREAERRIVATGRNSVLLLSCQPYLFGRAFPRAHVTLTDIQRAIVLWNESDVFQSAGYWDGAMVSMGLHLSLSELARIRYSHSFVGAWSKTFLARFLVTFPREQGGASTVPDSLAGETALCAFNGRARALLAQQQVRRPSEAVPVSVSPKAVRLLECWRDSHETAPDEIKKLVWFATEHILRLAVVLRVFSDGIGDLPAEVIEAADCLFAWYARSALRMHAELAEWKHPTVSRKTVSAVAL